jgi:hypothetical protein
MLQVPQKGLFIRKSGLISPQLAVRRLIRHAADPPPRQEQGDTGRNTDAMMLRMPMAATGLIPIFMAHSLQTRTTRDNLQELKRTSLARCYTCN